MTPEILKSLEIMEHKGFKTHVFATGAEMRDYVMSSIPEEASVGFGGSMTVNHDLHLYQLLKDRGNPVYYHGMAAEAYRAETLMRAHTADVYLMSCNAATYDGKLLNIDGNGNRVAALCYGPKTVYLLLGVNKFAADDEAAMAHVKEVACPANAKRLGKKTPCGVTGKCADCNSPERMCNLILWLEHAPGGGRDIHVCVADEVLGY